MKPGIYFGLDEDAYHADPALSSSGIRNLLVSPLDYWINSRLNPDYEDEKTAAMVTGTAFHRRLLEPHRFAAMYATAPTKDDFPEAIDGADALKAECKRLGLKKGGKIADLCERILEKEPSAQLWPVIQKEIMSSMEGRTILKPEAMADIERMAKIVFAHPSAAKVLSGGHAEVSIFWNEETENGVLIPMKSRLDYLKTKAVLDVKSFSNSLGKPVDVAVAQAVAFGRYDVQAVIYDRAVQKAKEMLRRDKLNALHGADDVSPEWLLQFAACERHAFAFVFIETGPVTNVRLREFTRMDSLGGIGASSNMYWQAGMSGFQLGLERYGDGMKKFGPDKPWIEDEPMRQFADQEFPLYLFN